MRPHKQRTYLRAIPGLLFLSLLAACAALGGGPTPTPEITGEEEFTPVVSATGVVIPSTRATLSFPSGGLLAELLVAEGEHIGAGQTLARLGNQEQLQAAVKSATLAVIDAGQRLDELYQKHDVMVSQAQLAVATARDALDEAQHDWEVNQPGNRALSYTLKAARAQVVIAEKRLERTQTAFDHAHGKVAKAKAQLVLSDAHRQYDRAVWLLDWLESGADEIEQGILDAELANAQANLDDAIQEYQDLEHGPDPSDVELAQAQLENAQAQLEAAQSALEDLELVAPFPGTIADIYPQPGEWVGPGQPILVMADLGTLRVETTDLNEIDVAQIHTGDTATVSFDALPEVAVGGTVTYVSPKAEEGTGVNYTVVIELDQIPNGIYWGMTAFVDILVGEG
jgi:HlyD family secretion protein